MTKESRAGFQGSLALKWIAASAAGFTFGQASGMMAGSVVGALTVPSLGEAGVLLAIATIGGITGALLGLVQRYAMQRELDLNRQWVLLSGAGWAVGYPAAALGLSAAGESLDAPASSLLYWLVIGASLGLAQWWILRRMFERAAWWAAANIVGWILGPQLAGLVMVAVVALGIQPDESLGALIASALVGAAAGIFSGVALSWLRRHPVEVDEE